MFITTHALIGALIAEQIPAHPFLAFFLSMMAHFLADIVPHGDSSIYKGYLSGSRKSMRRAAAYVAVDGVVALFFTLALFNTKFIDHRFAISLGIAGGVLPDLLVGLYEMSRIKELRWFHRLHFFFHNLIIKTKGDIPLRHGLFMQAVLLLLILSRF